LCALELRFLIDQQERLSKFNTASLQKNTDNFVKFIDKANSIDVDKIKTVRDMFEQMSRFSESVNGNFEKLSEVLSEKLVDILEKLHITLQDLKDTTNGVQTNNIVVPAKPDYSESIVSAQNSAKNNINEQTKKNNEQERMIAQNQQLSQSINNSLSAIQSLLEEFDRRGVLLRS
jgi:Icc-related predicted phosphoesterase